MNIRQIRNILTEGGIEENEAKIEAQMLCEHFLKRSKVDLLLDENFDEESPEGRALLQSAKERAQTRKPIQHIIGTAYFMGEDFIVNEHVLIPRDETEILVRAAVKIIQLKNNLQFTIHHSLFKVLDIGTGSGCIACMIAKLSSSEVVGVDISDGALEVARKNAQKIGVSNNITFKKSDLFSQVSEKFDVIVSNPPYIPLSENKNLQMEVAFDPQGALFAPDEQGVEFYDKIVKEAPRFLNEGGCLLFELGIGQSAIVKDLMQKAGFENIQIEKDLAQIDRVIYGEFIR